MGFISGGFNSGSSNNGNTGEVIHIPLSSSLTSNSESTAATSSAVKNLNDKVSENILNTLTVSGVIAKSNGNDDNETFKKWLTAYEKIYIPKGVTIKLGYTEVSHFLTIEKPVEIYGGGTIEFIGDFSKTKLIRVRSDNVVFKGITFINNTGTYPTDVNSFLELYEFNNIKIIECKFFNGMIYIYKGRGSEITSCKFFGGSITGRGGIDHHIHGNSFDRLDTSLTVPPRTAIVVQSFADNTSEGYLIENNWIYKAEWAGITLFRYNKNSVVKNNRITMVESDIESFGISLAFIDNCKCQDNLIINDVQDWTYAGIELVDCTGSELRGNKIKGFRYGITCNGEVKGLGLASNRNNHIENNTVEDFSEVGIRVFRSASGNVVRDNTFEMSFNSGVGNVIAINIDANDYDGNFMDNLVSGNKVYLTKTASDGFNLRGIYIDGENTKCSENTIKISAPDRVSGIRCTAPSDNSDIMTNKIVIEDVIDNTTCFGMYFGSLKPEYAFTNVIVKYNKIIAPLLLEANKLKVDAQGNSIIDENFIE